MKLRRELQNKIGVLYTKQDNTFHLGSYFKILALNNVLLKAPTILANLNIPALKPFLNRESLTVADESIDIITEAIDGLWSARNMKVKCSLKERLLRAAFRNGVYHPKAEDVYGKIDSYQKCFKIMLYGPPGSGKTSIINSIEMFPAMFIKDLDKLPEDPSSNTLYIIEDIDLLLPKKLRDGDSVEKRSLRRLLSFLDRVKKVIVTTNNPQVLDPAFSRAGRIDLSIEIGYLNKLEDLRKLVLFKTLKKFSSYLDESERAEVVEYLMFKVTSKIEGEFPPCDVSLIIDEAITDVVYNYKQNNDDIIDFKWENVFDVEKKDKILNVLKTVSNILDNSSIMVKTAKRSFLNVTNLNTVNLESFDDDDDIFDDDDFEFNYERKKE